MHLKKTQPSLLVTRLTPTQKENQSFLKVWLQAFSQDTHRGCACVCVRERGGEEGKDEQVPVFLVSTDTWIGTCDHNSVTLTCSNLHRALYSTAMRTRKHTHTCTQSLRSRARTHTHTMWLTNQNAGQVDSCAVIQYDRWRGTPLCVYVRVCLCVCMRTEGYLHAIIFLIFLLPKCVTTTRRGEQINNFSQFYPTTSAFQRKWDN